jgi:ribosomal protein S18 acetylase RimI-like enzyme
MSLLDRLPPRTVMVAPLPIAGDAPVPDSRYRTVTPEDLVALAELLVVAYSGTVDDLGQTPAEALEELEQHTTGEVVGPPLWDASFLSLDGDTPVATVLTTNENGRPLLAYIYTHPKWQSRGLATALIRRTAETLHSLGFCEMTLRVALANEGARRLYERLGFTKE